MWSDVKPDVLVSMTYQSVWLGLEKLKTKVDFCHCEFVNCSQVNCNRLFAQQPAQQPAQKISSLVLVLSAVFSPIAAKCFAGIVSRLGFSMLTKLVCPWEVKFWMSIR